MFTLVLTISAGAPPCLPVLVVLVLVPSVAVADTGTVRALPLDVR